MVAHVCLAGSACAHVPSVQLMQLQAHYSLRISGLDTIGEGTDHLKVTLLYGVFDGMHQLIHVISCKPQPKVKFGH